LNYARISTNHAKRNRIDLRRFGYGADQCALGDGMGTNWELNKAIFGCDLAEHFDI
jgi:hypothetical protein